LLPLKPFKVNRIIESLVEIFVYSLLLVIASIFFTGGWHFRTLVPPLFFDFSDYKLYGGLLGLTLSIYRPHRIVKLWTQWKLWATSHPNAPVTAIWTLIGVFGLLLGFHFIRHWMMLTDACDLFFLHQSLFYPWYQGPLHCNICNGGSFLGEHLSWTLFILTPITFWIHSDELLFCIKTAFLLIPILLAFKYGPLKKQEWFFASLLVVFIFPLRNALVWDFREDDLAFAFSFGAVIALYRGWIYRYFLFLALILFTKENYPFITFFLAAPILWDSSLKMNVKQRNFVAAMTCLLSLLCIWLSFHLLIPFFSHEATRNNIVIRFPGYGSTASEVVRTILTSPNTWWKLLRSHFLTYQTGFYLIFLLGPFFYFLRYAWIWGIPALPGILMNTLSASNNQRSFLFHYELVFLPYLIMGTWIGIEKLRKRGKPRWALPILIGTIFIGDWPTTYLQGVKITLSQLNNTAYLRSMKDDGSIIAADNHILGQLSRFRNVRKLDPLVETPLSDTSNLLKIPRILLNRDNIYEETLLHDLLSRHWIQRSQSPNGKYIELGSPNQIF